MRRRNNLDAPFGGLALDEVRQQPEPVGVDAVVNLLEEVQAALVGTEQRRQYA